jgi:hypothetical protein
MGCHRHIVITIIGVTVRRLYCYCCEVHGVKSEIKIRARGFKGVSAVVLSELQVLPQADYYFQNNLHFITLPTSIVIITCS